MADINGRPRYVYGVVPGDEAAPQVVGIDGEPVELVAAGELAALISAVPDDGVEVGRDELLTHSQVLEAAVEQGTVLPMRFGVVVAGVEIVRDGLLDGHRDALAARLAEMDGKVEVALKGLYYEHAVLHEIAVGDPEIARLRAELADLTEAATEDGRSPLGRLVAAAFAERQRRDSAAIVERLRPQAVAVRVGEPAHERMAVNASFLVERGRLPRFARALADVRRPQAARMRLRGVGPLPPHSFVELGLTA